MSRLLLVLFGLFWCFGMNPAVAESSYDVALDSSVSIEISSPRTYGDWVTIGTGTLVKVDGRKSVLTAKHIAEFSALDTVTMRACSMLDEYECIDLEYYISNSGLYLSDDWAIFYVDKFPKKMKAAKIRTTSGRNRMGK